MMYVDLRQLLLLQNQHTARLIHNLIRTGITETLEASDYTSIQERILAIAKSMKKARQITKTKLTKPKKSTASQHTGLYPFLGSERQDNTAGITYSH